MATAQRDGTAAPGLEPTIFVLFGATGDLAKRMVLPAFYQLALEGLLPKQWLLVGNGRGDLAHEDFRAHVHDALTRCAPQRSPADWKAFSQRVFFAGGGFNTDSPGSLLDHLEKARKQLGGGPPLVHYLAVPPASLDALDLQAAREKVISSFRPLDPAEVVLGQFNGYHDVPGVAAKSSRDTYVAARMWIDNPRWRGVPFYLRTGERLAETRQRVSVVLREPDGPLAGQLPAESNMLSFSLAGDGEIDVSL